MFIKSEKERERESKKEENGRERHAELKRVEKK